MSPLVVALWRWTLVVDMLDGDVRGLGQKQPPSDSRVRQRFDEALKKHCRPPFACSLDLNVVDK